MRIAEAFRLSLRGFFLPASSEKVASLENCLSRRMRQMAKFEVTKIEEQGNGRLLFNVRAYTSEGRIEFPIGIQDLGSPALDELAVLRSTLGVADELAASIRLRLEPQAPGHSAAAELIARVGLSAVGGNLAANMSGGQAQREDRGSSPAHGRWSSRGTSTRSRWRQLLDRDAQPRTGAPLRPHRRGQRREADELSGRSSD
jgi:hypothetical protein